MITYVFYFIAYYVSRLFSISYLVGSAHTFFSGACVVDPLAGLLGDTTFVALTYLGKVAFSGLSPLSFITRLPGLCGALYWKIDRALFRCGVPLLCMVLFLVHATGFQAWGYSLFWLIPIAVHISKTTHFVWHAFASTFTTHAVGSVIWLYTKPMTAAQWWALIPVVIVERCLIVIAMRLLCRLFLLILAHDKLAGEAAMTSVDEQRSAVSGRSRQIHTLRGQCDQTFSNSDGRQSSMGKAARATRVLWPWRGTQNSSTSY